MSESSLSDLPEMDFTSTPQRGTKHTLSSLSPSPVSERPSKKIKLVYRKSSQRAYSPNYHQPPPQQHQTSSPYQRASSPEMTVFSTLELQHLRENNGFLRRSNIELAKAHAQVKAQVGVLQEQVKTVKEESHEAQEEIGRLSRENELLGTMTKEGFDPATAAKRMTKLEELRKIYWECGLEWARKEKAWGWEKELFKKEVMDLVGKVEGLEGELAEERAKVRRFEGEILEREREQSMRRGMVGGGQYAQQHLLENGVPGQDHDAMRGMGMMMVPSEHGGSHVTAPSWQMQQSPGREQRQMSMQQNGQQQYQDTRTMHGGQGHGHEMVMGAQALQDLGRGGHIYHQGQEQQRMLTMQEQFEAQQEQRDTKIKVSPGQFDGLMHGDEGFSELLTGPEVNGKGHHDRLIRMREAHVEPLELQARLAILPGDRKSEVNDNGNWDALDDEDGTYDPETE